MLRHQTFVIPFVRSFCLQILKKKTKRSFLTEFIWQNQSDVLLVLDGLDELPFGLEILHSFLGVKANQWEKTRGTDTGKIVDMSAIFQLHEVPESKNSVTWRRSRYIAWERQPTATNLLATGPQRNQKKGIVSWNSNLCCCWDVVTSNLHDSICEKLLPPDGEKENKTEFF